ncbi:hypothetical protein ACFSTC_27110 [Nonomuraea ferruginea]
MAECLACDSDADPGFGAGVVQVRAADVSFVLDQLPSRWDGAGLIDRSRIAMVSQSIGGASSVAVMVKDSRVRARASTWTAPPTPGSPKAGSPGRSCSSARRSTSPAAGTPRGSATGSC